MEGRTGGEASALSVDMLLLRRATGRQHIGDRSTGGKNLPVANSRSIRSDADYPSRCRRANKAETTKPSGCQGAVRTRKAAEATDTSNTLHHHYNQCFPLFKTLLRRPSPLTLKHHSKPFKFSTTAAKVQTHICHHLHRRKLPEFILSYHDVAGDNQTVTVSEPTKSKAILFSLSQIDLLLNFFS